MPFLRFTRDHRGYEYTFLLHTLAAGARPRVLYWYRSAPGVRVGRPALDEDAIRTIEEHHPELDFDWPHILEVGAATAPEVERRPERKRRKPAKSDVEAAPGPVVVEESPAEEVAPIAHVAEDLLEDSPIPEPARPHDVLEELVGREIATRLRARYAEISARIHQLSLDPATREMWHARAQALNPDNWITPKEILDGVSNADQLFDALRRELLK